MRIALIAGEESGDILGAGLVRELRQRYPDAIIEGMTGPRMEQAGCTPLGSIDELSLMGIVEILKELPRLLRLRRRLLDHFAAHPPDVFIGIDAPDFNLKIEQILRRRGIPTVHYVCPTVWAWRQSRVRKLRAACDRVLCIFPFEPAFLEQHGVNGVFVGHPLAEQLAPERQTRESARQSLGLEMDARWVSILPGSRMSEANPLSAPFVAAARNLARRNPQLRFVAAMSNARIRARFEQAMADVPDAPPITLVDGRSRDVISAGEVVLLASGTATLETLILERPMVVGYAVNPTTARIVQGLGLLKTHFISMPNLIAGRPLVPELIQNSVTPGSLSDALYTLLHCPGYARGQLREFHRIGEQLSLKADVRAADAVAALLG